MAQGAVEEAPLLPVEGSLDRVLSGEASWCVAQGDALHVLGALPDHCVHAFVTDPPYSSGGAFRGDRVRETSAKYVSTGSANKEIPAFEGDVRDQRSFTLWTALWSSEAWRAAADGCHLVAFSDWRQLPALCDAVQAGGWLCLGQNRDRDQWRLGRTRARACSGGRDRKRLPRARKWATHALRLGSRPTCEEGPSEAGSG